MGKLLSQRTNFRASIKTHVQLEESNRSIT